MKIPFEAQLNVIREKYRIKLRFIAFVGLTIFFLSVFDSIMSYITPVLMTDSGLSEVQMGFLYSSSSFFGLILDFVLAKVIKVTHYKSTFLFTCMLGILFPLLMFVRPTYIFFLIGMFVWGLYYNLWGFARSDFVARESKIAYHVVGASLMMAFHDIGYITGTLAAQPILDNFNYIQILQIVLPIILLAILFQIPSFKRKEKIIVAENTKHFVNKKILYRLFLVSRKLFPLLLLGVAMSTIDAITWTVTPIIDRVMPELESLGGVILAVNFLPSFIAYSVVYRLTNRFGKKHITIICFMLGSGILSLLGFTNTAPIYLLVSFTASFFIAISYAAYAGTTADYLNESKTYDNEIMSTNDMSTNIGYIIGPILGGTLLSFFNSTRLFTYTGIAGILIGLIVIYITPKKIPFYDRNIVEKVNQ